jgi:hypothetical protein
MAIGRVHERRRSTEPRIPAGMGIVGLAWVKGDEPGGGGWAARSRRVSGGRTLFQESSWTFSCRRQPALCNCTYSLETGKSSSFPSGSSIWITS